MTTIRSRLRSYSAVFTFITILALALLGAASTRTAAADPGSGGVKDGLITEPRSCKFDPAALACKGEDAENCLTPVQVESVKRMYAPSKFSNGTMIFPGKAYGSEASWTAVVSTATQPIFVATGSFELAYQDPKWDWKKFDIDRDVKFVDEKTGFINAVDPDLSKFKARGGRILMYHGWNDTAISPENSLNYYNSVQAKMGRSQDVVRLFMMPGMAHCAGGQGPDQVNFMGALERWREQGIEPKVMIATKTAGPRVDMTRPICAVPQVATYKGTGSTNDAENFVCK